MKAVSALLALSLPLAGCGVGPYHVPDVPPVVLPEPEEDLFADLDMEGGGESPPSEPAPAEEPAQEPAPAEEPSPAPPAAEEPKPKAPPAKKK
jgi:hypothetical protein